jgi:hypothetical protein
VASWAVATAEDDDQRQGSDEAVGSEIRDDSSGSCGTQKGRRRGMSESQGRGARGVTGCREGSRATRKSQAIRKRC